MTTTVNVERVYNLEHLRTLKRSASRLPGYLRQSWIAGGAVASQPEYKMSISVHVIRFTRSFVASVHSTLVSIAT